MAKKILLNWRYYVLFILFGIATINLLASPCEEHLGEFMQGMLVTKGICFVAGYVLYRIIVKWEAEGSIPELTAFCDEED